MAAMTTPHSDQLSVLVVDDEASVLRQLVDGLRMCGHVVVGASSAADALMLLAVEPQIGAVMTDIRMPGLDGLNLAQRIMQERDAANAVEVVVMTGHATIDDAAAAVRTRVSDFLRKPFRLADGAQALSIALERARIRRRDAAAHDAQTAQLKALEEQRNALADDMENTSRRLAGFAPAPDVTRKLERDMHAISHALRTPLIAIAGGADLLGAPSAADDAAEYLSILREGVRQARDAVDLVDELHQVERAPSAAPSASLDLAEIGDRATRQLQPAATERRIRIAARPAAPVKVRGDRTRLPRAVELCLGAALDWAQPSAEIGLAVNRATTAEGAWAVLTILVSPPGTEADIVLPDDIAFPETSSLWSRTQEGLRFAIARRIAEQHGGRLTSWNGGAGMMAIRLTLPL